MILNPCFLTPHAGPWASSQLELTLSGFSTGHSKLASLASCSGSLQALLLAATGHPMGVALLSWVWMAGESCLTHRVLSIFDR